MKNVRLAYILTFLSECYWPSVAALFLYLRHFDFAQIATLWALQMAVGILLEVPTGAFADIVGRKISIILSFILSAIALFATPFATTYIIFAVIAVAKGLANALYSGSMEALVYDSLKQEGKEQGYTHVSARMETIMWACWALSSLGGGYLYYWHYASPWVIQSVMFVAAALIALNLTEPTIDTVKVSIKSALTQNLQGFRELFATQRTMMLTAQLAIVGAGYIIASEILGASQAREYGMDARATGWIFAAGCLASVVAAHYFPRIRTLLGEKKLLVVTSAMMLTSFLLAKYVGLAAGVALIIMRIASSSTFRNTRSVVVNKWITSRNRATALSTLSLLTQTPYIFLSPVLGLMIDKSSPNQFAFWLGLGILLIVGIVGLLHSRGKIARLANYVV